MIQGAVNFEDRIRVPSHVFDLRGYRQWVHATDFPAQTRVSFIAGEIDVSMSPEEIESHTKVKGTCFKDLAIWIDQLDLGELLCDGALLVNESADLATEPDVTFCAWGSLESGRASYREVVKGSNRFVEVSGSPDLVVEVVSKSSVRKDTELLPATYYAAGIREYWIIDARSQTVDFRIMHRGDSEYVEVAPSSDGYRRSDVVRADVKLVREPNRVGTFRYNLVLRALPSGETAAG